MTQGGITRRLGRVAGSDQREGPGEFGQPATFGAIRFAPDPGTQLHRVRVPMSLEYLTGIP